MPFAVMRKWAAGAPPVSDVVSLLHFNGSDESTTFTDETGKVWTAVNGAQLDTAVKHFGTASLKLDPYTGSPDHATTPANADFGFGTGDFQIQLWANWIDGGDGSNDVLIDFSDTTNGGCSLKLVAGGGGLAVWQRWGASYSEDFAVAVATGTVKDDGLFHYYSIKRIGTTVTIQFDTTTNTGTDSGSYPTSTSAYTIGCRKSDGSMKFAGWIDEVRTRKGGADSGTTVPTGEFSL